MSIHFKQLKRLVEEPTFSQILIPLQSVLIPTLPSTGGASTHHDAFPGHWAYLDGFEDVVREMSGGVIDHLRELCLTKHDYRRLILR